jgi:hypothetical protein
MMETMSNAQAEAAPGDIREQVISEAIDAVYEGMLAIARFGRRQPLVVAGLGAAAALGFVALKPSARKAAMDTIGGLVDSVRSIGSQAGGKALRRAQRVQIGGARARQARGTRGKRRAHA